MRAYRSLILLVAAACLGCKPPLPKADPAAGDGSQVAADAKPVTSAKSTPHEAAATNVTSSIGPAPAAPSVPALTYAQERAARERLKSVVIAMHTYHDSFRGFPPSKAQKEVWGPDGKPHLSWRVMLLPYLDEQNLFKQFRLSEPWNSEHNLKLLDEMPEVYKTGDDPRKTSIVVVCGPGAVFDENGKGSDFRAIKDGTSKTILVVQAGPEKAVPWTKPEDVPLVTADPLSALGNVGDTLLVALCDGAVKSFSAAIPPDKLTALFTVNGEEYVRLADYEKSGTQTKLAEGAVPIDRPGDKSPSLSAAAILDAPTSAGVDLSTALGDAVPIEGLDKYHIRPPKKYDPHPSRKKGQTTTVRWAGPHYKIANDLLSYPYVDVVFESIQPESVTAEGALSKKLEEMASNKVEWRTEGVKRLKLGNLDFVRETFTFRDPVHGPGMGFVYATVDGTTAVTIASAQMQSGGYEALPLANASALSLRKVSE